MKLAKAELENPLKLKPYFERFNEEIPYAKIRIALAILAKEGE